MDELWIHALIAGQHLDSLPETHRRLVALLDRLALGSSCLQQLLLFARRLGLPSRGRESVLLELR